MYNLFLHVVLSSQLTDTGSVFVVPFVGTVYLSITKRKLEKVILLLFKLKNNFLVPMLLTEPLHLPRTGFF